MISDLYSDFVFSDQSTQEGVYNQCVHNLLVGAFDGYNATVLAYGQVNLIIYISGYLLVFFMLVILFKFCNFCPDWDFLCFSFLLKMHISVIFFVLIFTFSSF